MNITTPQPLERQDDSAPHGAELTGEGLIDIVKNAVGDVQELLRAELSLAEAELTKKAGRAAAASVPMALGVMIVAASVLILLLAIAAGIATGLPVWASLLIVGVVSLLGGSAAVMIGAKKISQAMSPPQRTIDNLRKDAATIRKHAP